ncbi:MAG: DUF3467 domain-containing protein [Bacteroidales bacterium]|jgi:hypothetical protein|nr:DUF3467 domain-containing protein [Bacteroidales bacterium]MDD3724120.1 DUF3467 domain-containing protein [Bacteroidales bacterium]MDD4545026.1 DUF3467 domain-containing protein [Bacteroidales bacterium]MDY0053068.1 DUF3467 domain-containing protein [Bacteroidales bacterium]
MENKENKIDIELPSEIAPGVYSNLQLITHSNTEFILDFIQIMPGVPKAQVRSRTILCPQHAKRLLYALKENIDRFEAQNGIIDEREQNTQYINPMGQA